jgi:hypothetical protein
LKDFIRDHGKTIAMTAAMAMVLSLIIGLFTGNLFGVAFFRAILLAVFFALFASAVIFTLKKYLPELADKESPVEAGEQDAVPVHAVDIVLPEEPMLAPEKAEGGEPEARDGNLKEGDVQALSEPSTDRYDEPEALEEVGAAETPMGAEKSDAGGAAGDGAAKGPEGEEAVEGADVLKRAGRDEVGSLDNLPDFGFIGESAKNGAGAGQRTAARPRARRPEDAARGFISEEDPESLAKAIRTVIKRDEKG